MVREILMSYKPDYIREAINNRKSNFLILKSGEVCKNKDCLFAKYDTFTNSICPGKDFKRDNDFICDLFDLSASHRRGLAREAKQFAEAVAKRKERR